MGPRDILDVVVKRKIPSPNQELNSRIPIIQPVAQCYINLAIMAFTSSWQQFTNKVQNLIPCQKQMLLKNASADKIISANLVTYKKEQSLWNSAGI
jgi:hypothetical protein